MNKNILMLCYYFPPLADVGAKRSVAFSKYLKKHGWNPHVLSVKNPDKYTCSIGNEKPPAGVATEYSFSVINPYIFVARFYAALSSEDKRELNKRYYAPGLSNLFLLSAHSKNAFRYSLKETP
jgi:hypothetical protein